MQFPSDTCRNVSTVYSCSVSHCQDETFCNRCKDLQPKYVIERDLASAPTFITQPPFVLGAAVDLLAASSAYQFL